MLRLGSIGSIVVSLALSLSACSSDDDATAGPGGGGGAGGTSSGGTNSGGTGALSLGGTGGGGSGGSAADGGIGNEDSCDGIDNDNNGIIDDVDVGKDGICDCLKIGTIGLPGQWGGGNVFAAWLDARSAAGAVSLGDQVLTPALLEPFQVIVVEDASKLNRSYAASEVSALSDWVNAGGGLMTLIGYADPTELANVNLLLGAFGMSYGSQQILQKQGSSTVPVTNWVNHPVTNGVSLIGVDNGYPVQGAGVVLATEQSFEVLRAHEVGQGKVLMWGDEWITYDSEWSGHPEYQVELFWLNAIKWLTPADQCQVPIPPTVH